METQKFNPNDFVMDFKGRPYLQVAHRVLWFKMENGHDGSITTDLIRDTPFPIYKATISIHGAIVATGHGTAQSSQKQTVWSGKEFEKAETAAIGRALANAGYGTQFSEMLEDDTGENIVDSPATRKATATHTNGTSGQQSPQNATYPPSSAKNGAPNGDGKKQPSARDTAIQMLIAAGVDPNAAIKIEPPPNPPVSMINIDWATRMIAKLGKVTT